MHVINALGLRGYIFSLIPLRLQASLLPIDVICHGFLYDLQIAPLVARTLLQFVA